VTRLPHFDLIAFVIIVVAVVVLFIASISWTWVGEALAGVYLVVAATRWMQHRSRRPA
jgi:hypothetical protein